MSTKCEFYGCTAAPSKKCTCDRRPELCNEHSSQHMQRCKSSLEPLKTSVHRSQVLSNERSESINAIDSTLVQFKERIVINTDLLIGKIQAASIAMIEKIDKKRSIAKGSASEGHETLESIGNTRFSDINSEWILELRKIMMKLTEETDESPTIELEIPISPLNLASSSPSILPSSPEHEAFSTVSPSSGLNSTVNATRKFSSGDNAQSDEACIEEKKKKLLRGGYKLPDLIKEIKYTLNLKYVFICKR